MKVKMFQGSASELGELEKRVNRWLNERSNRRVVQASQSFGSYRTPMAGSYGSVDNTNNSIFLTIFYDDCEDAVAKTL